MTMWRTVNSEGFNQAELNMFNRVLERIFADAGKLDRYSINDALNKAWHEGITEAELEAAVRKQFGLSGDTHD